MMKSNRWPRLDRTAARSRLAANGTKLLRELGWDVLHVGELQMAEASDAAILEYARSGGRVICTLDADFHHLLALSGVAGPSVIRIRQEGLRAPALIALLIRILPGIKAALERGSLVSVTESAVRNRHLPI